MLRYFGPGMIIGVVCGNRCIQNSISFNDKMIFSSGTRDLGDQKTKTSVKGFGSTRFPPN